ncbi:MAG: FAD-binding protein, partial [Flavobacteriales bacterium]|nr:FAD-binding protein [Flavobacteriales bacterium]
MNKSDLDFFELTIGQEFVFTDNETRIKYGKDETENLSFPADVVLKPGNTMEVSRLLKYCNEQKIPVTAIGAQTGLSGGAL